MMLKRIFRTQSGNSFVEYTTILGVAIAALVLVTSSVRKAVEVKLKQSTNTVIGNVQETQLLSAQNIPGGRRLADQSGLYSIKSEYGMERDTAINNEYQVGGTRSLSIKETGRTNKVDISGNSVDSEGYGPGIGFSGNSGAGRIGGAGQAQNATFEDAGKKKLYTPKFVKEREGNIKAPMSKYSPGA